MANRLEADIRREIELKIRRDNEVHRKAKKEAEEIRDYCRSKAPSPAPGPAHVDCVHEHPYATGTFQASIHLERQREKFGLPTWRLISRDPIVNMLEYGTGPDKPGSRSPWGPDTPTPEFGMFAQTALRYKGTVD